MTTLSEPVTYENYVTNKQKLQLVEGALRSLKGLHTVGVSAALDIVRILIIMIN